MKQIDLSLKIGPMTLKNPIITASGTFGYGLEFADLLDLSRLGAIVLKGLSLKPRRGNEQPRIAETASGMLNSIGLQNVGVEEFLEKKLPELVKYKPTIIANIFGQTIEEYVELAKIFEQVKEVAAIELNLSCPNVKKGGIGFGTDPQLVQSLTAKVREVYRGCLIAKLTPNVTDICPLALAAKEAGADALSCINTLRGMAVDIHSRRPKLSTVTGGLSGPAIKPVALAMIHAIRQKVDIPIIGIGGITTIEDVLEFLIVGAVAVQLGTVNYINATIAEKMVEQLELELANRGEQNLNQLVGSIVLPTTE